MKPPKRKCAACPKEFTPKVRRQQYCSHTCKNRAAQQRWYKRHAKRILYPTPRITTVQADHERLRSNDHRAPDRATVVPERMALPHKPVKRRLKRANVPASSQGWGNQIAETAESKEIEERFEKLFSAMEEEP